MSSWPFDDETEVTGYLGSESLPWRAVDRKKASVVKPFGGVEKVSVSGRLVT